MRLPASKVYRAFPELDRFTDAECREYVRRAIRNRVLSMIGAAAVAVILAIIAAVGGPILVGLLTELVPSSFLNRFWLLFPVLGVAAFVAGPALVALSVRNFWLRRAIRSQLNTTLCPQCGYQLLGLPMTDGVLQCPECGRRSNLNELGASTASFIAASGSAAPAPAAGDHPPTSPIGTTEVDGRAGITPS